MQTFTENLNAIHDRIHNACVRVGRHPSEVRLVAVSKTHPPEAVRVAIAAGQMVFGENRVQEARDKIPQIETPGVEWHLIGPLQRNKVKTAIQLFTMIHSVDSIALAEELNHRVVVPTPLPILIQVNVGGEKQKYGLAAIEVEPAIRAIARFSHLAVRGLMTVPPYVADPEAVRPHFRALADLAKQIRDAAIASVVMDELSMGMSHDFEVAVEEGATLVRVGSALFGSRG